MNPEVSELLFLVMQTLCVICLLFAFFGSSRPTRGVLAAGATFCVVTAMWSNASGLDMAVARVVAGSLLLLPLAAFVVTLIIFHKSKPNPLSPKSRVILLVIGLLLCVGGILVKYDPRYEIHSPKAEQGINLAIKEGDPEALRCWINYKQKSGTRPFSLDLVFQTHGLSKKTCLLLSVVKPTPQHYWDAALKFPPSPERLKLLQCFVPGEKEPLPAYYFIQLMGEGDSEAVELLYPYFQRNLDAVMIRAKRLDLLAEVVRRGSPSKFMTVEDKYTPSALEQAANNSAEYTAFLLDAGYKPTTEALQIACRVTPENRGVAQMLLAAGADPNGQVDGPSPLQQAIVCGADELVDLLLTAGANDRSADRNGRTALHAAAMAGNLRVISLLHERGVSTDAAESNGFTPLHWAAFRGDPEACALLLQAGASVNVLDAWGYPPVFYAANQGHAPVLAVLLEKKPELIALVNAPSGNTEHEPFSIIGTVAAYRWHELLDIAKNIGLPPASMGIPDAGLPAKGVWLRTLERKAEAVKILLAAGADPFLKQNPTLINVVFAGPIGYGFVKAGRATGYPDRDTIQACVSMDAAPLICKAIESLSTDDAPLPVPDQIEIFCRSACIGFSWEKIQACVTAVEAEIKRGNRLAADE